MPDPQGMPEGDEVPVLPPTSNIPKPKETFERFDLKGTVNALSGREKAGQGETPSLDIEGDGVDQVSGVSPTESESDPWIVGDMTQMVQKVPPSVRWLVDGLIPAGVPGFFAARAGAGKSMTSLWVALGLSSGRGVLGRSVSREAARGVLYVSMEDEYEDFWRRVHNGMALMREDLNWSAEDESQVMKRLVPIFPKRLMRQDFRLDGQWKNICSKALNIPGGCGLIVLDTFARLSGGDENSAHATRPFLDAQTALAQATGAAVMAIHHIGKGNAATGKKDLMERLHPEALRGSSAIEASARFIITMASLSLAEAERGGLSLDRARRDEYVALSLAKMSQGEKGTTLLLERRSAGMVGAGFMCLHPESERVLAVIKNGETANKKLTLQDKVLLAICEAGSLTGMDQEAAAKELWPDAEKPLAQWQKHLTGIRKEGWLSGQDLTAAGFAQAETLGFASGREVSDGEAMEPNNVLPGLPLESGD